MNDAAEILEEDQDAVKGLGETLKEKRQALGLDINQIAEKLHLKPSLLMDIEAEQYDPALSVTFTKGYIRLYAKHLGLHPEEVLALFDTQTSLEKQPTKLRSFSQKVAKQASDARLMMVTYVIIALVVGLLIVWWVQQSNEQPAVTQDYTQSSQSGVVAEPEQTQQDVVEVQNSLAPASYEATSEQAPAEGQLQATASSSDYSGQQIDENPSSELGGEPSVGDVGEGNLSGLEEQAQNSVTGDDGESDVTDNISTAENISTSDVPTYSAQEQADDAVDSLVENLPEGTTADDASNSGLSDPLITNAAISDTAEASAQIQDNFSSTEPQMSQLVFRFSEDCWMNLTDATGEVVAYGVKASGYVMPVEGVPPFEVVLGAPQAVSITVDGQPFDMSVFPAGRTARFMIGSEE